MSRCLQLLALLAPHVCANGAHDLYGNVLPNLAKEEIAVSAHGKLNDEIPTIELYKNKPVETRGAPPYPFPKDRKYNTGGGPVEGKINVHLVPHSHDDTGWQVTVDQYFEKEVFFTIDTVVQNLAADPNRRFIYVETAFFARWWEQASDAKRAVATTLVKNTQLEFTNGGWCMHDEASPLWTAMVDQTTRGHQFILKNFGADAAPRATWQIDPFGHSNTQAWLLGAEAGFDSFFWGRMDWQDRDMRRAKQQGHSGFEWIWQGSQSLGSSAQIFAGNLYGTGNGGYSTWMNFDGATEQVIDDPSLHDYNADQWVDKFVQDALEQDNHTLSSHQMWACGADFQFQNADHWYRNLDKLIHYVNLNGSVNAFYSTPARYTDEKKKWKGSYEVRTDDIWPLGDHPHAYWSGYFTSRPALKRQVRFATNLLVAARQLEVVSNLSAAQVGHATERRSPVVGGSWTDSLEATVGVATHHDGMSGTERQSVTDDYAQRISESSVEVEAGIALALGKLLGLPAEDFEHCSCNAGADCLNISVCAATTGKEAFTVAAWNPLAQATTAIARLPVSGAHWAVTDAAGRTVASQAVALDDRTRSLPLLYLNSHGMDDAQRQAATQKLANAADHVLLFELSLPPVGLATFRAAALAVPPTPRSLASIVEEGTGQEGQGQQGAELEAAGGGGAAETLVVASDTYSLAFDTESGMLKSITNLRSGASTALEITWGWYNSSVGGCTDLSGVAPAARDAACDSQKSGAYIFRPNSSTAFYPGAARKPSLRVVEGDLVTEIYQDFSEWASHVIRLYKGRNYVEVEWTAGPIPIDTPWLPPVAFEDGGDASSPLGTEGAARPLPNLWGKEVIVRYASGLRSGGRWYTDSNGKEMVPRNLDKRGPSYPHPYKLSEPVAGNYYPVSAMQSLDDGTHELAVLTDVTQGGSSLQDGALEFMVHRRLQADDNRGVQEPLNETMCGCNDIGAKPGAMGAHGHEGDGGCECAGLTVRGRHWLVFDEIDEAHKARREISEELNFPPLLAFHPAATQPPAATAAAATSTTPAAAAAFSAVSQALPPNLKLVTLTNNYAALHGGSYAASHTGRLLLRLAHLYQVGEHPDLAQPATVDLQNVFGQAGLRLTAAVETTLSANRLLEEADKTKHKWQTRATDAAAPPANAKPFEQRVPFVFPKLTVRPMEVRTFLAEFAA